MLVFAARWIGSERGNADAVLAFDGLGVPGAGRAVRFRRQPPLDVPAIDGGILWFHTQFDSLAQQGAMLVAVLEFSAYPSEAIPTPCGAVIWFAEAVRSARAGETMRHCLRRVVRFAEHANHFDRDANSSVFTMNLCSPQFNTSSVTFPTWPSTIA